MTTPLKHCSKCKRDKQRTEYSKCNSRKDGLQPYCKSCNSKNNKKFRKENPLYWDYEVGYFSEKHKWAYISEWAKADKPIKIYKIELPSGKVYIGSTKAFINLRMNRHVNDMVRWRKGELHRYIHMYSEFMDIDDGDGIGFKEYLKNNMYILEETHGGRKRQFSREQWWMNRYETEGYTLANKNRAVVKK
jgi:hypothetical protein